MENAPVTSIIGRNVPSDIKDRFNKWQDEVYHPSLRSLWVTLVLTDTR